MFLINSAYMPQWYMSPILFTRERPLIQRYRSKTWCGIERGTMREVCGDLFVPDNAF